MTDPTPLRKALAQARHNLAAYLDSCELVAGDIRVSVIPEVPLNYIPPTIVVAPGRPPLEPGKSFGRDATARWVLVALVPFDDESVGTDQLDDLLLDIWTSIAAYQPADGTTGRYQIERVEESMPYKTLQGQVFLGIRITLTQRITIN